MGRRFRVVQWVAWLQRIEQLWQFIVQSLIIVVEQ